MLNKDEPLSFDNMHEFDPLKNGYKEIPDKKGIYCICIRDKSILPVLEGNVAIFKNYCGKNNIIYIGIAIGKGGLRKRLYKNHMIGSIENSTVRKSIFSIFKFIRETKEEWIKKNLIFYYEEKDIDNKALNDLKKRCLKKINPPLNIQDNKYSDENGKNESGNYQYILRVEKSRNSK